jgi:hypothetical protein
MATMAIYFDEVNLLFESLRICPYVIRSWTKYGCTFSANFGRLEGTGSIVSSYGQFLNVLRRL